MGPALDVRVQALDVRVQRPVNLGQHRFTILFICTFLLTEETHDGRVISEHKTVTLRVVCGPSDDGEPIITHLLPKED